ncbi:LuxR C-terminal-related transcriptional regulator [Burkholderia sp. 3C]
MSEYFTPPAYDSTINFMGVCSLAASGRSSRQSAKPTIIMHARSIYEKHNGSGMEQRDRCEPVVREGRFIEVVIADCFPIMRYSLMRLLESEPGIAVVASVGAVRDIYAAVERYPRCTLICDYNFGDDAQPDGLQLVERIVRSYLGVRTIFMSTHAQMPIVSRIFKLGAHAFVRKCGEDLVDVAALIHKVQDGARHFEFDATSVSLPSGPFGASTACGGVADLSVREIEVMRMWAKGLTVTEIAVLRKRSKNTISAQKANAMKKLGVRNAVELLTVARKLLP